MKQVLAAMVLTILGVPFAFGQTATYQGVTLQPGDVINFHGGVFTTGGFLTYGHSALYLGVDPRTGQRSFLDFTTSKESQRAFVGRILPEREFLTTSAKYHKSFDIFRLQDVSTLNQQRMLQEAKRLAVPAKWFFFSNVCSTAVAAVLSKATGFKIIAKTPDYFVGGRFKKHPDLVGKIIIQEVLNEHDILLKNSLIDITKRSCTNPGSVTQAELNSLPRPYRENFHINSDGSLPHGLGDCSWVYIHLSMGERDAEKIRTLSVQPGAVAIRPAPQPAVLMVSIPFESLFPELKEFAMTACRSSEQVSLAKDLCQPRLPLSFNKRLDDSLANSLSLGLGDCERQLFHKLIEMIRAGQGRQIDGKWVGDMVALYQPARKMPPSSDGNSTPPPRGDGCFMQSNPFGPPYRVCPK